MKTVTPAPGSAGAGTARRKFTPCLAHRPCATTEGALDFGRDLNCAANHPAGFDRQANFRALVHNLDGHRAWPSSSFIPLPHVGHVSGGRSFSKAKSLH